MNNERVTMFWQWDTCCPLVGPWPATEIYKTLSTRLKFDQ